MNTSYLKPSKLLMVDENGNECELNGTIEFEEVNTNSISEIDPYKSVSATELSMTINIDNSTKLTRKKLIKLLMAKGIQRNGANEIAKHVLKKNGKYTIFDLLLW
jgi:hypothetical protein